MNRSLVPPRSLTELAFRHKGKLLFIPLFFLAVAVLIILFSPRTYHSESVLFLQVGRASVGIDPTAITGKTIALQEMGRENEVKTAIDILSSRGVIAKTVDRIGAEVVLGKAPLKNSQKNVAVPEENWIANVYEATLGRASSAVKGLDPVPMREEAIIAIEKSLSVGSDQGSTAIALAIEAESPELAQALLVELISVFQEEHGRIHRNQNSLRFFQGQHADLKNQLDEAKQALRQAKNEMGIATIEGRRLTLEKHRHEVELAKYQAEQQLATSTAQVAQLQRTLTTMPARVATSRTSLPNQGADLLRKELYALEIRKADLSARYNDNHPLVLAVSHQVDEAQKVVGEQKQERLETVDDVNEVHQELSLNLKQQQSQVAGLESRLETLHQQLQLVQQDIRTLNDNELRIDRLQREERLCSEKFYKYADNLEQARIDHALEEQRVSNIAISQEPLLLHKPVSPSKVLSLLASMFLATAVTGVAIAASEKRSEEIRQWNAAESERLTADHYGADGEEVSQKPVLSK